ncbi:YqiA/YcfP family alpha/beta fold hydrolase [Sulfurimonas sp. HSL3-7]|uniref:YqiA/YcfP family alpha/beta fold hydrolase n=1 Tax=Sulfonitrofixus jiaomeiensis TaxID=3131938 RepID=UPI0031F8762E
MILYLHGFASCGNSTKTQLLKKYFGENNVLSPDLPVDPHEAIDFIRRQIFDNDIDLIIGSSLGGFYATYFVEQYGIKTVLINPSTQPFITLAPYVGTNHYWCSGDAFEFTRDHLNSLFEFAVGRLNDPKRYLVLLQTGDEVLDYTKAQEKYEGSAIIVEEGGNHRFENLDDYLDKIKRFRMTQGSL